MNRLQLTECVLCHQKKHTNVIIPNLILGIITKRTEKL